MREIWHLAERAHWDEALATGVYERSTRGRTLAEVGFVHCSYREQVAEVARVHFAGVADLVLLRIEPDRVPAEIKVEGGFPHVYGPIPVDAVTDATPFDASPPDPAGS